MKMIARSILVSLVSIGLTAAVEAAEGPAGTRSLVTARILAAADLPTEESIVSDTVVGSDLPAKEPVETLARPIADQMELRTIESRPTSQFWKELDKEEFLKKSIDRHTNEEGKSKH